MLEPVVTVGQDIPWTDGGQFSSLTPLLFLLTHDLQTSLSQEVPG